MSTELQLLNLFDAAAFLGQPARWLERQARRGAVPCRQLPGGDFIFDQGELREWARALPRPKANTPETVPA
jgi:hypothetical protein